MTESSARSIVLQPLEISPDRMESLCSRLNDLAQGIGLEMSCAQVAACIEHLLYVDQINSYINLTRITDLEDALTLHILDSLTLIPFLAVEQFSFVDMGTGAGFPGVPLGIITGQHGVLLDSVGKKVKAVNAIIGQLGLSNLTAVHDRLETFAQSHRAEADVVVARALAQLPILLEYAAPLLQRGGQLLVSKGNPGEDEVERGRKAARLCGFELYDVHSIDLPGGYGHREIYDFRLLHKPSVKLPRADGMARKQPLA